MDWSEAEQEVLTIAPRGEVETRLNQLKAQLLKPFLERAAGTALVKELHCAANEAAALAWFTVCPLLFFPVLLEEKVQATLKHWERQAAIYHPKVLAHAA